MNTGLIAARSSESVGTTSYAFFIASSSAISASSRSLAASGPKSLAAPGEATTSTMGSFQVTILLLSSSYLLFSLSN